MTVTDTQLVSILLQALSEPVGLVIHTNNSDRLRQRLYKLRKRDPQFSPLAFVIPAENPTTTLNIMKKNPECPDDA